MYITSQLLHYIVGLGCLAQPFSHAATATFQPPIDEVDQPLLPLSPGVSPSGTDALTPNSTNTVDVRNIYPTDLQKRDDDGVELFAMYLDEEDEWDILKTNNRNDIVGAVQRTDKVPIGGGVSGQIFDGLWEPLDEDLDEDMDVDMGDGSSCKVKAAIKFSPERIGYNNAKITKKFTSDYIVKTYAYATVSPEELPSEVTGNRNTDWSLVVYKKLDKTAEWMLQTYWDDLDRQALVEAVMEGMFEMRRHKYYFMDLKFDNVMIKDEKNRGKDAGWEIIDLGALLHSETGKGRLSRTKGWAAPEIFRKQERKEDIEKAVVFMLGMFVYYASHQRYERAVTQDMRNVDPAGTRNWSDTEVKWLWVALVQGVGIPQKKVVDYLPERYQPGQKEEKWGEFYQNVLCERGERTSLDDMWSRLKGLMGLQ